MCCFKERGVVWVRETGWGGGPFIDHQAGMYVGRCAGRYIDRYRWVGEYIIDIYRERR